MKARHYIKIILSFCKKTILCILLLLLCADVDADALQKRKASEFHALSKPLKRWVILNPFIAREAYDITEHAKKISEQRVNDSDLDGDKYSGQIDAFRHTLWMALVARRFGKHRAVSLGRAYEESNYLDFLAHKLEDGAVPDFQSCEMDLRNNSVGAEIGRENRHEPDSVLIDLVKDAILSGRCWVIHKNIHGNFIDSANNVIPSASFKGQWQTAKVLVPSNQSRKIK